MSGKSANVSGGAPAPPPGKSAHHSARPRLVRRRSRRRPGQYGWDVPGRAEGACELAGEIAQSTLKGRVLAGDQIDPHAVKRIIAAMIPFATPRWADALQNAINTSPTYREAAREWEGDFWFVIEPGEGEAALARALIYLDLWHGQCRLAEVAEDEASRAPEFRIWGPRRNWRRVIERDIDPIRALMTGSLRLKGNMAKVMRNVRSAQELVLCAAAVPTLF